jgi:sugar phosphate isomerase/epimerase
MSRDRDMAATALGRLKELTRFAAEIGSPLVTIGGFRGRAGQASNGRDLLVKALREGAAYAGGWGIRIVLEPLNRYETDVVNTAEEGLAMLEDVGERSVGLLLDTFHCNIEERDLLGAFQRAMDAGRLWHVHVGDNNRRAAGWGAMDFAMIVAGLAEMGYDGYLSGEHLAIPDPDSAGRQTLNHLHSLLSSIGHQTSSA